MAHLLKTIFAAIGAFAVTNVDDFVLLTILFIDSQTRGGMRRWNIIAGQYLGFIILLVISGVGAVGLVVIRTEWVGWLGLLPLVIGVYRLIKVARYGAEYVERPAGLNGVLSVAAATAANGGDNLALYVLIFHTQAPFDTTITVAVFLLLLAIWCAGASLVGTRAKVISVLVHVGEWLVPGVYFIIGSIILVRSGVLMQLVAFVQPQMDKLAELLFG